MRHGRHWAMGLAAAVVLALGAGCGGPGVRIRQPGAAGDEPVAYQSATFQLARERKVQIVLFRRTETEVGAADADFEYVFLELPERKRYGWLRGDGVPAYRWVHEAGRDLLWLGSAGQAQMRFSADKDHVHVEFRVTMEPIRGTAGQAYVLEGSVRVAEDPVRTQGLINQYGPRLALLVNPPPPKPPAAK